MKWAGDDEPGASYRNHWPACLTPPYSICKWELSGSDCFHVGNEINQLDRTAPHEQK